MIEYILVAPCYGSLETYYYEETINTYKITGQVIVYSDEYIKKHNEYKDLTNFHWFVNIETNVPKNFSGVYFIMRGFSSSLEEAKREATKHLGILVEMNNIRQKLFPST